MRHCTFLVCVLICSFISYSQPGKKPKQTGNPTSQKEIDERLRASQKQLESLTPEQRKQMEQLGITLPGANAIPARVTNQQIAAATGNMAVKEKDIKRINSIPKQPLNNANLPAQISKTNAFVYSRMDPAMQVLAEKFYKQSLVKGRSALELGNTAAGFWAAGYQAVAIYMMSKASVVDPTHGNNLNNYASMLSMNGAEEYAIPLLNYLNAKYPSNSTILNNLGQAWFGLGELDSAGLYLKKAIRLYAYHPQANLTQSIIEESKGDKVAAVESVKRSIRHYYSVAKENRLRKLGYKLTAGDVLTAFKPDPDPFRLTNFRLPPIPKSALEEQNTAKEWVSYSKELEATIQRISLERSQLSIPRQQQMAKSAQQYLDKKPVAIGPEQPYLYQLGALKLKDMEKDGGVSFRYKKAGNDLKQFIRKIQADRNGYLMAFNKLDKKDDSKEGAGGIDCKEAIALQDKYLNEYNKQFEDLHKAFLLQTRIKISEELYWKQFMQHPEEFEITKRSYQLEWLAALNLANSRFIASEHRYTYGRDFLSDCLDVQEAPYSSKLAEFNIIRCPSVDTANFLFGQIITDCTQMITKLDLKFVTGEMRQDLNTVGFKESYLGCTVALNAEMGLKELDKGPVRLEAKLAGSLEFEFDRTGLSDIRVSVEGKAGLGNTLIPEAEEKAEIEQGIWGNDFLNRSIEIGVKGTISLISGQTAIAGTGVLEKE